MTARRVRDYPKATMYGRAGLRPSRLQGALRSYH